MYSTADQIEVEQPYYFLYSFILFTSISQSRWARSYAQMGAQLRADGRAVTRRWERSSRIIICLIYMLGTRVR